MTRLFISNRRLEAWSSEGKIALEGTRMMLTELGRSFEIKPAVFFARVAGGEADPHDLLGKVKDEEELATMGADHMASSVIYVETAYEVVAGFIGAPAL